MELESRSKEKMIYTFSIIGFLVLALFGIDNIFLRSSYLLGFLEIILSGFLILNFLILKFSGDVKLTSILTVVVLFLALVIMYISGGISGNTGIFWYFTFPVVSIFLLGQKSGLVLNLLLLVLTYLLYFFRITPFDFIETRQLSIAMIVVSSLVVVYWRTTKDVEDVLKKKSEELEKSLETIKVNTIEEKDRNEYLENSKKAMVNLLEDAKELETKLRDEKDFSEKIISLMGEGLIMVDDKYKLVLANSAAKKILGLKEANIGGYLPDFLKVVKEGKELPKDQRPLLITLKSGKSVKITLEDDYSAIINNRSIPISLVTTPIEADGKITGALVNFHDLTKDKEVKTRIEQEVKDRTRELSEEKAKLLSSIEALTKAFVMVDTNSKVILTNKNLGSIFDSSKKYWELGDIQERLGESFNLIEAYKKNLKTKAREAYQVTWGTKYLEIRLSPVFEYTKSQSGKGVIGTLIIIGDVTEAKILERSKDEFFSIASHELRTPLTAIRGNASLIKEFFSHRLKDKELLEMIDDIEESSIRLIDIVNDFLNMGRLEQGRLSFKLEDFDLNSLIKDSLKQYQVTGSRQKLSLNCKLGSKPIMVHADKDRTRQTLINLIGNGLKFTEKGGVIVSVKKDSISACCYVKDTGRGIPVENQKLLFRKFQQAGSSIYTRDTTKGTGLGLYISKLMVEGMNGRIWLDNSYAGKGSTFAFCLPLSKSEDK